MKWGMEQEMKREEKRRDANLLVESRIYFPLCEASQQQADQIFGNWQ